MTEKNFFKKQINWILLTGFILILFLHQPLQNLQRNVDDYLQIHYLESQFRNPIKIVYFDDQTIQQIGSWPIPRNYYAYLIHVLEELNASVLGIDVFFPRLKPQIDEDEQFLVSLNKQHDNIVNSFYFVCQRNCVPTNLSLVNPMQNYELSWQPEEQLEIYLPFSELLKANPNAGYSNLVNDSKGVIREVSLGENIIEKAFPAFSTRIALEYIQMQSDSGISERIARILEMAQQENQQINFKIPPKKLPLRPAMEIIQAYENREITKYDLAQFKNSIVLISVLSENLGSYRSVPIAANYPVAGIHAQIVDNILTDQFLTPYSRTTEALTLLIFLIIFLFLLRYKFRYFLMTVILLLIIYGGLYFFAFGANKILPVISLVVYSLFCVVAFLIFNYNDVHSVFQKEINRRKRLEKELTTKITDFVALEDQLKGAHQQELQTLDLKLENYRSQINVLKNQIKDQIAPTSIIESASELQATFPSIIFAPVSPMGIILRSVKKVAATHSTVLIIGESGTGKELVARAIHCLSPRKDKPFVAFNCAAFAENLIESEIFGHEKGAFTGANQMRRGLFESANGGTIFLDEITETTLAFQAKLLRVVQEKEFRRVGGTLPIQVDVRIIATTNRDMKRAVACGDFREDLYYRLSVLTLEIPSLRERKSDIPLLIQYFLKNQSITFSQAALELLQDYHWPGNIRELQNLVQRSIVMADTPVIQADWLQQQLKRELPTPKESDGFGQQLWAKFREKEFKFSAISEVGEELGRIHRSTVTEHLKGIFFQAFYENHFQIMPTVRQLNPIPDMVYDERLEKRLNSYITNLEKSLSKELPYEQNLVHLTSRFKNLPQKYHFYLEEIIRDFLSR